MRLIVALPLVLVAMLGLVTITYAQQCSLTLNTTLGYVNVTTNAQSISIRAWGVVGITNNTDCSFKYIAFKYSLLGMSSLVYIHTSSNSSSYIILNSSISRHILMCLTLNPVVAKNNVVELKSEGGSISAYCSIVNEGLLTQYSLLLAVLIGIALISVSYFTIRSLLK